MFFQLVNNDKEQTDFTSLHKVKPNKACWGQEFQNMQKKKGDAKQLYYELCLLLKGTGLDFFFFPLVIGGFG